MNLNKSLKKKKCRRCKEKELFYRNGLPISKFCTSCKQVVNDEKKAKVKLKKKMSVSKLKAELEELAKTNAKIRDNYVCQHCEKKCIGSDAHGSHVIPVSHGNQFRFDLLNIKCLCMHCHLHWWHKNPIEASEWFKAKFPDRYEYLFGQPHITVKFTPEQLLEKIQEQKDILNSQSYEAS